MSGKVVEAYLQRVLTADRIWQTLDIGVPVILIR